MQHTVTRKANAGGWAPVHFLLSTAVLLAGGAIVLGPAGGCKRDTPAPSVSEPPAEKPQDKQPESPGTLREFLCSKWMSSPGDATKAYEELFSCYERNILAGTHPACDDRVVRILIDAARKKECDLALVAFVHRPKEEVPNLHTFQKDLFTVAELSGQDQTTLFDPTIYEAMAVLGLHLMEQEDPDEFERHILFLVGLAYNGKAIEGLRDAYMKRGQSEKVDEMDAYIRELKDVWRERKKMVP